jgi:hypothetical protein
MQAVSMQVAPPVVDSEFGALVDELRPAWKARITGFFLVLIFTAIPFLGGLADGNVVVMVVSGALSVALIVLIQLVASAARVRVFVNGIERRGRFRSQRLAWSQLRAYQLQIVDKAIVAAGVGGLLGVLLARLLIGALNKNKEPVPNAVVLLGADGSKLSLSANVKGYAELQKRLVPFLTELLLPQAQQAFESGMEVAFGKKLSLQRGVGITLKGVFGKPHVLPLELATSVTLERAAVHIRRADTNAIWQSLAANQIENLGVLQQLVARYGRRYDEGMPMAWTT